MNPSTGITDDLGRGQYAELSETLLRAYAETAVIVQRIRDTGTAPESAGFSVATEAAASSILESIARAFAIVEALDDADYASRAEPVSLR